MPVRAVTSSGRAAGTGVRLHPESLRPRGETLAGDLAGILLIDGHM